MYIAPYLVPRSGELVILKCIDRVFDLINLNSGIDEHAKIIDAETNDLNGVLEAQ
jgi:hypothetical protein